MEVKKTITTGGQIYRNRTPGKHCIEKAVDATNVPNLFTLPKRKGLTCFLEKLPGEQIPPYAFWKISGDKAFKFHTELKEVPRRAFDDAIRNAEFLYYSDLR